MLEQLSNRSENIGTDSREKQSYLSPMPNDSVSPQGEISRKHALLKKHSKYPGRAILLTYFEKSFALSNVIINKIEKKTRFLNLIWYRRIEI